MALYARILSDKIDFTWNLTAAETVITESYGLNSWKFLTPTE